MQYRAYYLNLLCICLALLYLWACSLPLPYGDLRVRVTANDAPLSGAAVTVYRSIEDFNAEQNPYRGPELTDAQGTASFFGLEDTVYYINVAKETLNNWESSRIRRSIIITENGFSNVQSYDLRTSISALIAAPQGKTWQLNTVELNGEDITAQYPDCEKDNTLTFFKGGVYQEEEQSLACQTGTPTTFEGTWAPQSLNATLTIRLEDGSTKIWNILQLETNALKVGYQTSYQGNEVLLYLYFVAL